MSIPIGYGEFPHARSPEKWKKLCAKMTPQVWPIFPGVFSRWNNKWPNFKLHFKRFFVLGSFPKSSSKKNGKDWIGCNQLQSLAALLAATVPLASSEHFPLWRSQHGMIFQNAKLPDYVHKCRGLVKTVKTGTRRTEEWPWLLLASILRWCVNAPRYPSVLAHEPFSHFSCRNCLNAPRGAGGLPAWCSGPVCLGLPWTAPAENWATNIEGTKLCEKKESLVWLND